MAAETNPVSAQEPYVTITLPLSVVVELLHALAQKNKDTSGKLAVEIAKIQAVMGAPAPPLESIASFAKLTDDTGAATSLSEGGAAGFESALDDSFSAMELIKKDNPVPPSDFLILRKG